MDIQMKPRRELDQYNQKIQTLYTSQINSRIPTENEKNNPIKLQKEKKERK